jgi:hypothetical protein
VALRGKSRRISFSRAFFYTTLAASAFALGASSALNAVGASVKPHSHHEVHVFPLTGFGGYQWFGAVTQISAHWVVPSFVSKWVLGQASTWVGAKLWQ